MSHITSLSCSTFFFCFTLLWISHPVSSPYLSHLIPSGIISHPPLPPPLSYFSHLSLLIPTYCSWSPVSPLLAFPFCHLQYYRLICLSGLTCLMSSNLPTCLTNQTLLLFVSCLSLAWYTVSLAQCCLTAQWDRGRGVSWGYGGNVAVVCFLVG